MADMESINRVTHAVIRIMVKVIIYTAAILVLYKGVIGGYQFGYEIFHSSAVAAAPGVNMHVTIGEGEKLTDIAAALEEGGLIRDRYAFIVQSMFYEYGRGKNPVKAGSYTLNNSMTSREIILLLRDGSGEDGDS